MVWVIGFIIGLWYGLCIFAKSTELDNKIYESGLELTRPQIYLAVFICFLWPLMIFFPKFKTAEFYYNFKFKKK